MRVIPPDIGARRLDPGKLLAGTSMLGVALPMNQSEDNVLDMSVIESLRELGGDGDDSLFRELLELYLDDSTKQLKRLEQSLASGDLKVAERIAHTLKSSSANLGAVAMSRICLEMEMCGRKQSMEDMCALLDTTRAEHRRAVEALSALRA